MLVLIGVICFFSVMSFLCCWWFFLTYPHPTTLLTLTNENLTQVLCFLLLLYIEEIGNFYFFLWVIICLFLLFCSQLYYLRKFILYFIYIFSNIFDCFIFYDFFFWKWYIRLSFFRWFSYIIEIFILPIKIKWEC